jgi:C4-dicarboxylate-specific signal transduction histidine kinase
VMTNRDSARRSAQTWRDADAAAVAEAACHRRRSRSSCRTTKTTGLGLGLALCRSIVPAYEGRLTASGAGSRRISATC